MLTRYEQETIINFNAEEKTASIYTATPAMLRKMNKLLEQRPSEVKLVCENEVSKIFEVPVKWVKVSPPRKVNLTYEQKQAAIERGKKLQNYRKK